MSPAPSVGSAVRSPDAVEEEASFELAEMPDVATTAPALTLRKSRRVVFIFTPLTQLIFPEPDQVEGPILPNGFIEPNILPRVPVPQQPTLVLACKRNTHLLSSLQTTVASRTRRGFFSLNFRVVSSARDRLNECPYPQTPNSAPMRSNPHLGSAAWARSTALAIPASTAMLPSRSSARTQRPDHLPISEAASNGKPAPSPLSTTPTSSPSMTSASIAVSNTLS